MGKKKILIVSQHFPPEIGAGSNRMEHLCRHLSNSKYELYVITSQPSYPNRVLYTKQAFRTKEDGYHLYRVPIISFGRGGVLSRIVQYLVFLMIASILTLILSLRYRIKICITTSPPFSVNMIGWLYKITGWKRRWIMEVRDLWPDSMTAVGAVRREHILFRILKNLELHFYKVASHLVVVTPHTKLLLEEQGIPSDKIKVITNGVPDWVLESIYTAPDDHIRDAKFLILYAGNLGKSQNLGQLIEAAEYLREYQFHVIGDGLEKRTLLDIVERKGLKNVKIMDAILDKASLGKWYAKADLGVISLKDAELFEHVIPSKVFEYAGARLPILYIGKGEGAELVERFNLGRTVMSKTEHIINEINFMYDNIKYYRENNVERDKFIELYRWSNLVNLYIELIKA